MRSVQDIENQRQDDESRADPLGGLGQTGVEALGLALGHKGVGHAADGAGEAGALAGLEQHRQDHGQAA